MKLIDLMPTWRAVMPMLIAVLEDGSPAGKVAAKDELARLAVAADNATKLLHDVAGFIGELDASGEADIEQRQAALLARIRETTGAKPEQAPDVPADAPEQPADAFQVGAIIYASWGHEQTNVDFYRLEARKGPWVMLQRLETIRTPDAPAEPDGPATFTGKATPGAAAPVAQIRRKLLPGSAEPILRINDYTYGRVWDGEPKRYSEYA